MTQPNSTAKSRERVLTESTLLRLTPAQKKWLSKLTNASQFLRDKIDEAMVSEKSKSAARGEHNVY